MENNAKQGLGFVFGLLAGSLIGAATAIILAPQSGQQTRELIKQKALETREKATTAAGDLKVKATSAAGELKEDLGEWTERTKAKVVSKFRERLHKSTQPETVAVVEPNAN